MNLIQNYLRQGQTLILESTSYPGTTREILGKLISTNFTIGKDFYLGFSSERINPGQNENNLNSVPKVVSGFTPNCLKIIKNFMKNLLPK